MVVVKDRVGKRHRKVSELFGLRKEVQHAVFDVLQDVGLAVRTVQVDIALFFAHERFVAVVVEEFPCHDEAVEHVRVGADLDIEVARVEEAADVQAGDQLIGLVRGAVGLYRGFLPLKVSVEVIARRSLHVAFLEGFAMPDAVRFVDRHVVHVDGKPHVTGGVGDLVVNGIVDDEVSGLVVAVLDVVDAGLLHLAEVEFHIVVLVEVAPHLDLAGVRQRLVAVFADLPEFGGLQRLVVLVKLDHGHLRLIGDVSHLGETDVRFADPARDGVRFDDPGHHFAGLVGGQQSTQRVPAVLSDDTAVEQLHRAIRRDLDHAFGRIRRDHEGLARFERQRIDELAGVAIVVGAESLVLPGLILVRQDLGLADRVTREPVDAAVRDVGLAPVLGGDELQVETGLAHYGLGQRLVQIECELHRIALRGGHDARNEIVVVKAHLDFNGVIRLVHSARRLGDQVPLLGGLGESHGAALDGSHAMMNDLDAGVLLVVEPAREGIAEHQEVDALPFKIAFVVQDKALLLSLSLPGLLGLQRSKDRGQREQRGHDEGGTIAEIHADSPYSAEETAVVLRLLIISVWLLAHNIYVSAPNFKSKIRFFIPVFGHVFFKKEVFSFSAKISRPSRG